MTLTISQHWCSRWLPTLSPGSHRMYDNIRSPIIDFFLANTLIVVSSGVIHLLFSSQAIVIHFIDFALISSLIAPNSYLQRLFWVGSCLQSVDQARIWLLIHGWTECSATNAVDYVMSLKTCLRANYCSDVVNLQMELLVLQQHLVGKYCQYTMLLFHNLLPRPSFREIQTS